MEELRDHYVKAIGELCEQCTDTNFLGLVFGMLAEEVRRAPEPPPCQVLELPVEQEERRWAA